MSISWIKCLSVKNKNNLGLLSVKSDDIQRLVNESSVIHDKSAPHRKLAQTTPCLNACRENESSYGIKFCTLSRANTISDANLSNVFETNPEMVRADSFMWPEVDLDHKGCAGHECLGEKGSINDVILYQRVKRKLKPQFTPPLFSKTGIAVCPEPFVKQKKPDKKGQLLRHNSSVLEDDTYYKTPGNMEFIDFNFPYVGHKWRYTTYAVPCNRSDWEWIYNYIKTIKNSFRRKYLSDLLLSTEPGLYKGHVAYLVRIESASQGNILQCRSGLPKCLKEILVPPDNSYADIECYISEYLIKRKYIFKSLREAHPGPPEIQNLMSDLPVKSQESVETNIQAPTPLLTKTVTDSSNLQFQKNPKPRGLKPMSK